MKGALTVAITILTGLSRRELYIDARDLQSDSDPENPMTAEEYTAILTARGKEKLADNQLVKSFETNIRIVNPTYELGKDYQLGDTITIIDENLGITTDAIVEAVERSVSGQEQEVTLTLGYGQPTIYDVLKRKAGI